MIKTEDFRVFCPLYGFQVSQVLIGEYTHEVTREHFKELRERMVKGCEIGGDLRIRLLNKKDVEPLASHEQAPIQQY